MGFRRSLATMAGAAASRRAAPAIATRGVRQFLDKAIGGFPGFPGARAVADASLDRRRDVNHAVRDVIDQHLRLAGAQGFVTNLGGGFTMVLMIPANLAGLALLQVRMVAAVAHLRGYDLVDPRVRAAVLLTLLGADGVRTAKTNGLVTSDPRQIATGPDLDPMMLDRITAEVTEALVARIGGKHATLTITRRVPIIGGAISAGFDAYATNLVGRYADQEFAPNIVIESA